MFNGEVVFAITDINDLEIDFGAEIMPTKIVNKGDLVALGRKAPKHKWIYKIAYSDEKEYLNSLEKMINKLCNKAEEKMSLLNCSLNFSIFSFGMAIDDRELKYGLNKSL